MQVRGCLAFPRTASFACDRQPGDLKQQMPKSTSVELQARFLSALLQEREVQPRASLLAQQIIEILPCAAAVVYLLETMNMKGKAMVAQGSSRGHSPG